MALLSASAINRLSAWIEERILTEDCAILRPIHVQKPSGGFDTTYPHFAAEKCAVFDAGSPAQTVAASQTTGQITKLIFLKRDSVVEAEDRITVGSVTYTVVGLFDPSTYQVATRVLARRDSLPK